MYDVIAEVFTKEGYTISSSEYPPRRLSILLINDKIDVYIASFEFPGAARPKILSSQLPISVVNWFIYYNSNLWEPQWPPGETFRKKIGKSYQSSESLAQDWSLTISSSASVDAIVKMVNVGRADYWLESPAGTKSLTPGLLKTIEEGYIRKPIFVRPLYAYFQNTKRGRQNLSIFDAGYLEIIKQGRLHQVYHRQDPDAAQSTTVQQTIDFIKSNYPGINPPPVSYTHLTLPTIYSV